MEKEKVQSAGIISLILGIICSVLFIIGSIAMITSMIKDKAYYMVWFLFIIFFLIGGMAFIFIKSYTRRKEFYIYSISKEGIINFDELNKEYIQVKDTHNKLFFVKNEDYMYYQEYELLHG